jgi:hypothetical protein
VKIFARSSGEVAEVVVLEVELREVLHVSHGGPLELDEVVVGRAQDGEIFDSPQHALAQLFEAVEAQVELLQVVGAERLVRHLQQLVVRQRQRVQLLPRQPRQVAQVRVVQGYRPFKILFEKIG